MLSGGCGRGVWGRVECRKARLAAGLSCVCKLIGRRPTLPHTRACSTIGAERLNFRVRDGNGWDPLAVVTQNAVAQAFSPQLSAFSHIGLSADR
jgi:hypothetical protein